MILRRCVLSLASLAVALMILAGSRAHADDWVRPAYTRMSDGPIQRMQAKPDCTCRAKGSDFVLGQEVCFNNATFRCVMDQNVTSWRQMRDGCLTG